MSRRNDFELAFMELTWTEGDRSCVSCPFILVPPVAKTVFFSLSEPGMEPRSVTQTADRHGRPI